MGNLNGDGLAKLICNFDVGVVSQLGTNKNSTCYFAVWPVSALGEACGGGRRRRWIYDLDEGERRK